MSKDKDLDWIEKSGGFEWTPGSPWPPEIPDEERCSGDDYHWPPKVKIDEKTGLWEEPQPHQHSDYYYDYNRNDPDRENPFTEAFDYMMGEAVTGKTPWIYESPDGGKTVTRRKPHSLEKEVIQKPNDTLKYQEDKSLKDLKEYVNTTYEGHYTSDQGDNVQTLDIIESVGDAKSFCRSNAIKYLTRYEKKGQAKRDILKAAHYCLLLYYFDGHTN